MEQRRSFIAAIQNSVHARLPAGLLVRWKLRFEIVLVTDKDGHNDYFEVYDNNVAWEQFQIMIFDRSGEKVFESKDSNFKWDGTFEGNLLNPAVFVYFVTVAFHDNHKGKQYKGSVTLLR